MKKLTKGDQTLDPIDRALIVALHQNARASIRALGRQVGLSAPGCSERLKRLEGSGVISGFSVELDAQALGFALQALVRVKPLTGNSNRLNSCSRKWLNVWCATKSPGTTVLSAIFISTQLPTWT